MTFKARVIDVAFNLAEGEFGDSLGNEILYSGLRCEASINNIAGDSLNSLQLRVYGMSESVMGKLSTLGMIPTITRKNIVTVFAGDDSSGRAQVFQGSMSNAWADYRGAPDVSFNVEAYAGYYEQVKAIPVNSYSGSTDVATIIQGLAKSIGYSFRNNGVTAKLASPYLAGSAVTQIKDCANHAGINYDISNGAVEIWPSGGTRDDVSLVLSPQTGLVGYPVFSAVGINVQAEFNTDIAIGRHITVQSSIPQACGNDWYCKISHHEISSMSPGGPWFTYATLAKKAYNVKV